MSSVHLWHSRSHDERLPEWRRVPRASTIHADRGARELRIDGPRPRPLRFATLRWLCPCAYCRGEAGLPGWLDFDPT